MKTFTATYFISILIYLFLSVELVRAQDNVNKTKLQGKNIVNVGVVLDMDKYISMMGLRCILMALSDIYDSHPNYTTRISLITRDSKKDVVRAASQALDLLKNVEVQAIIGPTTSMQANFIVDLGSKAQVPIISYSATSPSLSSIHSPYFVRAAQNDSSQVQSISSLCKAFGWRAVVPIYVDNEFGEGIVPSLLDAFQEIETRIPYRSVISSSATDDEIEAELYKLMTMQTRVFIVHMPSLLATRFFMKVKEIGMMSEGYVWILTDSVTNFLSSFDHTVIDSMQGVLGVRPYVRLTKKLNNFSIRWKTKFRQDYPSLLNAELNIYGLWAYDAATLLAMAVEKVGSTNRSFQKMNNSSNSTDLETFGISQTGPQLLQALLNTTFMGISNDFHLIDGLLSPSAYQIVNVVGTGLKGVGFWTPKDGLVRRFKSTNSSGNTSTTYNTTKNNLGSIIWPGDITNPHPKGWVIPTNGKRLRVGVPVKDGFREFVEVIKERRTNKTIVKGYCIDIFDAVMESLPYAVPYDYIPFATPDGKMAGTYNDLVYQVYLGNFDIVAGDTTIIANRSNYVDFTMPYTESGYTMIVPMTNNKRKNAWVFLQPLTWDLWVTTFFSFGCVGFTVWVLEHRVNEDFRGPASHQAGMIPWFSLSTMVFAHKEKIVSNLGRFVVIIWCFVVLILTQSYTASLTSMLTVQQLHPTFTDINQLIKKGVYVGYVENSFVQGFLLQNKIDEKKLVPYGSTEELDELFSNGSIAAAFDEIPYMKLFLSKYCSKYTMVAPTYKTDGYGFVFPIGSPLVHDVSRSILHVTEGDKMVEIEKKWFGQASCHDSSSSFSSNSLGLESFWGLFLISGIASILALTVFICIFVHKHIHILRLLPPDASLSRKIKELAQQFDKKDLTSHTFRNKEIHDKGDIGECKCRQQASPNVNRHQGRPSLTRHDTTCLTNCPQSPSSFSDQTGRDDLSLQGTHQDNGDELSQVQTSQGIVPSPNIQHDDQNHNAILISEITKVNH